MLLSREGGKLKTELFGTPGLIQLGMYSDSSHDLGPCELLSLLLVPYEEGKFKTEVFCAPDRREAGHVF